METNVNYTIVGAFVVFLLGCIILGVIWLSSGFSIDKYTTYKVYMIESVSGLSLDAPVEYNGVNVGSVKSIKIDLKNPQFIELLLNIKHNTPITNGTRAKLSARALTGVAFISLEDRGTDMTPLPATKNENYPVINTAPSFYLRVDTALTNLNDNIHDVSVSIRNLLDEENVRSIKQTLINLETITTSLSANTEQFNNIVKNTAEASKEFKPLIRSSIATMQTIQNQTVPAANQAMIKLNRAMDNLSAVSSEIKQNPAVMIRGKKQPVLGPGEK